MKCMLKNSLCDKPFLCCSYCPKAKGKCDIDCRENPKTCQWFFDVPCDLKNPEDIAKDPRPRATKKIEEKPRPVKKAPVIDEEEVKQRQFKAFNTKKKTKKK